MDEVGRHEESVEAESAGRETTVEDAERKKSRAPARIFTPAERLLLLDIWQRSEIGAPKFASLVGMSDHTLYQWQRQFEKHGPAGLEDRPRKIREGSRLPEPTQRAILMLKRSHSEWGIDRIHDVLLRSEGCMASAGAIQRVLEEAGYEVESSPTRPHPEKKVRRFERARPNQLWQSDLFTFTLKRENRRLYTVVFLDDHSRFVVGQGTWATPSGALVREVVEAAIADHGPPEEILTDQGPQYYTWRGKSAFTKLLDKRGIRHLVARARHPQTLGKTERFWGTLWRECLEQAIPEGVEDARRRIRHFIDHYNFQRTHRGIDGLVPADRFFEAESTVRKTLEARVAKNALDLARHGTPRQSAYLTGRIGDEEVSLHGEGGKLVLRTGDGERQELDLPRRDDAEGGA